MPAIAWYRFAPLGFLLFLPLSILWKGGKTLEMTWVLAALAWFCTLSTWARRDRPAGEIPERTLPTLWVPLMLFLLWTFLSYLNSSTGNYGLDEVLRDSSLVLLFLWFLREHDRMVAGVPLSLRTLQILVTITIVAAVVGMVIYIFQPVPRHVGSFFDWRFHTDYWPNAWAELVLMVWPLVVLWPFSQRYLVISLSRYFVFGILFTSLFLSYSRAAYIAFGMQLLLWGFVQWKREGVLIPQMRRRQSIGHILVLLCFSTGIVLSLNALRAQFSPVQSAVEKFTFTAAEGTSSIAERQQFWRQSWQLLWEKPLFGWGPYSFRFVQTRLQEGVFATSDHPHNLFLKLAMERGLPAAVLFGVFLLTILWPAFSTLLRKDSLFSSLHPISAESTAGRQLSILNYQFSIIPAILVSNVGVLFHLLLDFNLQFVGVALPFFLLLALLCSSCASRNEPTSQRATSAVMRFAEVSLATVLMLLVLFEGRFLLLSSLGRRAEVRGDLPSALTWYDRARGEMFSRDLHLSRAHLSLQASRLHDALRALESYLRVNREDMRAWKLLGDTQTLLRDLPAARTAYEEAWRLGRWNHLGAVRGLLETLKQQGERSVIIERRAEVDSLLEAYLEAIERNTHFIALTPNVEEFLVITSIFAEFFPEDAPRYQAMGARVDREAREERERIAARPVGRLW